MMVNNNSQREPCNCQTFLSAYPDATKREGLWGMFKKVRDEAQSLSSFWWREIIEVVYDPESGPGWSADSTAVRLNIPLLEMNNEGALIHELFHVVYDGSPIYKEFFEKNKLWGDGFCDAFRYCIEKDFLQRGSSIIYQKIDPYLSKREIEKMLALPEQDKKWQITNTIPAALIIRRCGDYEGFKKIWRDLNQTPEDLDSYFNFSVRDRLQELAG